MAVDQAGVAVDPESRTWLAVDVPERIFSLLASDQTTPPFDAVRLLLVPPLVSPRVPVMVEVPKATVKPAPVAPEVKVPVPVKFE